MSDVRILLGSGGFRTAERRAALFAAMRLHFGDVGRVLFVPYATADHERHLEGALAAGFDAGYELEGIHRHRDPVAAVRAAEAISIGGGNTFLLADALHRLGLVEPIRERVRAGVPYMGVSAGANVAGPSLRTTNDMPIVQPPSFETLGLVPFQINPHYFAGTAWRRGSDGTLHEHYGETRDERIAEFHEHDEAVVVALWEGAWLRIEGGRIALEGGPARVFRRGAEPLDLDAGARLESVPGLVGRPAPG